MPHLLYIIFVFALGACIGSFLNVIVWRLPRNESLISPPSRCPVCGHRLAWYDNIPIFGWLALRGRCRYCHAAISAQYPTVEFVTGALFVLYYVMFFIVHLGPCWMDLKPDWAGDFKAHYHFVNTIAEHWPQYALAVFTISALLAASMIDARQFWIPQSIPIVMAIVGLLYHTILDRPREPGALNLQNAQASALALGAGIGLLISLGLTKWGKLPRSFAQGWPALEIDKEPPPAESEVKPSGLAGLVGRSIDGFRRKLSPQQQKVMNQHQADATARDKEEAERQSQEEAQGPKPEMKEFSRGDITREMRKEMVFLMPPILLGMAAFALTASGKAPWWSRLVVQYDWLSGFLGALLGAMIGAFVVWLTRIFGSLAFGREAMGMGDVDLMFGVGAVVGAGAATVAFFVAPFFGLALAIYMLLIGKRRELPYGPYLSLGTAFVMIYYCPIAEYLRPGMSAIAQLLLHRGGN